MQTITTYKDVGGPCEGCEAALEFSKGALRALDTLPGFWENEPRLKLTGTVYHLDGTTPARDIILYIYHTDREGLYSKLGTETGWGLRHGSYRGWVRTAANGRYTFYTFRPAAYPDSSEPEHIHLTVAEPNMNPYYLDSYQFLDDPLLSEQMRSKTENRGGSGVGLPEDSGSFFLLERDIILGKNIPNYPIRD
jgi:protocatechuate 3,4-dioxygenase beta subunit